MATDSSGNPNLKPSRQVDAVLFDLDGTLVQHSHVLLPQRLQAWGHPRTPDRVDEAFRVQIDWFYANAQMLLDAERDEPSLWGQFYQRVSQHLDIQDRTVAQEMQKFLTSEPTPPLFEDAAQLLQILAGGPWRLGVITQRGRQGAVRFLTEHRLIHLFDVIVAGDDGQGRKPSPEPFRHALSVLGTLPDRAVYVGDRIDDDCGGACAAGLRAFLIDRRQLHPPCANGEYTRLHSLAELPQFL